MAYEYKIGTTLGGLTLLSSIPVIWPRSDFVRYSAMVPLMDGSEKGMGSPQVVWVWDWISYAQWTALRTYRTGVSSSIFIRTVDETGVWHSFSGVMIWPPMQEWVSNRALRLVLTFRMLVQEA